MFELCAMANNLPGDININCPSRMILSILCDRANASYECWPSVNHLSDRAGMSTRTVMRSIRQLEKRGFIRVVRKRNRNNRYEINTTYLYNSYGSGVTHSHAGVTHSHTRGDTESHEPIIEPIKEPIKYTLAGKTMKQQTLEDVQNAIKGNNPIPGLKPSKKISISYLWLKEVAKWRMENELSDLNHMCVSNAGTAQLKRFAKQCGDVNPVSVLKKAVREWVAFTEFTVSMTGTKFIPATPSIGFLLQNTIPALDFYAGGTLDNASDNIAEIKNKDIKSVVKTNPTLEYLKLIDEGKV